jgi:hypothetical protein
MPGTCRIIRYLVTLTVIKGSIDHEAIYAADLSSAYGGLEWFDVLSGGECQTHGPSVHFDSSLTDCFPLQYSGTAHHGRFLQFKMIFTTYPKAAKHFNFP